MSLEIKRLNTSERLNQNKSVARPDLDVTKQYISPPESLDATQKRLLPEVNPDFSRETVDVNKETLDLISPIEPQDDPAAWPEMVLEDSVLPTPPSSQPSMLPSPPQAVEATAKVLLPEHRPSVDSIVTPLPIVVPAKVSPVEIPIQPSPETPKETVIPEAPAEEKKASIFSELPTTLDSEAVVPNSQKNTEPLPIPAQTNIATSIIPTRQGREFIPTSIIPTRRPTPPSGGSSSVVWVGLALLVVGGFIFWVGFSGEKPKANSAVSKEKPVANLTAPLKPEVVESTIELSASLPSSGAQKIKIPIGSSPTGATVFVDGVDFGLTPTEIEVAADKEVSIRLQKEGFEIFEKVLAPNEDFPKKVALTRKEKPADKKKDEKKPAVFSTVAPGGHSVSKDNPQKPRDKKGNQATGKNDAAPNPFRPKGN